MNRQYKVIWSKVKHCYIVVSELVKRNGKSSSVKSKSGQKIGVTLAVLALCFGLNGNSLAADLTEDQKAVYDAVIAEFNSRFSDLESRTDALVRETANIPTFNESDRGISIGEGAVATEVSNIAIGYKANAGTEYSSHIAIGSLSEALGGQSIAIGNGSRANTGFTIAIGHNADVARDDGESSDSIGIGTNLVNRGMRTILIGGENGSQSEPITSNFAVGIGYHAIPGDTGVAIGEWSSSGLWGNSLGAGANAKGEKSLALGFQAHAADEGDISLGHQAYSANAGAISLGHKAFAIGENAVAIGRQSYAVNKSEIVESYLSDEHIYPQDGVVSVGNADYQLGDELISERHRRITNMAGGVDDYDAANVKQLKALKREIDDVDKKVTAGGSSTKYVSFNSSEEGNKANDGATGGNAMAVGPNAKAAGDGSTAVGWNAEATGIGHSAAYGANAKAVGQGSLAVGPGSEAYGKSGIAIGNTAISNTETLTESSIAIGDRAEAKSSGSIGMGIKSIASGKRSMAMGIQTQATGNYSMALGGYTSATGADSIALGHNAVAKANSSVAIGAKSVADRGYDTYGYTVDHAAFTSDDELLAYLGKIDEYNAAVDVVIANQKDYKDKEAASKADRNNEELKIAAEEAKAKLDASQQALLKLTAAYKSYFGAASVGTDFATRQITGVAAGSEDTDAVNVAQLKALNTKVDDNSVKYFSVKPMYYDDNNELVDETVNADNQGATGRSSMAIGAGATTNAANSLVIGHKATISDDSANGQTAIGYKATASGQESVALGSSASAEGVSVAIGGSAKSTLLGVAVGYNAKSNGSGGISVGNDAESNFRTVAVGVGAQGKSESSVAVGSEAATFADSSVATGSKSSVYGSGSIAIGTEAVVKSKVITPDEYNALSDDEKAGYVGAAYETDKFGQKTPTQYMKVENSGGFYNGMAIGTGATVSSSNGMALGTVSRANGENSVAVGRRATSNVTDGVALGAWSVVDRENGAFGYTVDGVAYTSDEALAAYIGKAAEYQVANEEFYNNVALFNEKNEKLNNDPDNEDLKAEVAQAFDAAQVSFEKRNAIVNAYKSGLGAVSVGNAINTRQITGVAAGSEDTDAVNVAQLKALNTKVDDNKIEYVSINSSVEENKANDGATATDTVAIGPKASATKEGAVAIGRNVEANGGVAIGENASSSARNSVAIGLGAIAGNDLQSDVAIGSGSKAAGYSVAIGNGATSYMDPNPEFGNGSGLGVAVGSNATVTGPSGVAVGFASEATFEANALGASAKATSRGAIAIGDTTKASGAGSVVLGNRSEANGTFGIAIGTYTKGLGSSSIGIGGETEATGNWSMAVGRKAIASADLSTSVGPYSNVTSEKSTAIGSWASAEDGTYATALGYYARTRAGKSVALGSYSTASGGASMALGYDSAASSGASTALGYKVAANVNNGVALGSYSVADRGSKVIGYNVDGLTFASDAEMAAYLGKAEAYQAANADFEAKLAVYNEKEAALNADPTNEQLKAEFAEAEAATQASFEARNAIIGAYRSSLGAISVGSDVDTRQITNVAAGSEDTDAVNVAQLKGLKSLVDTKTETLEDNSKGYFHANIKEATDPTWNNYGLMSDTGGAGGLYSVAAGIEAQVNKDAEKAVAIGYRTKTKQKGGIAVGYDTVSDGERAVAIGQDAVAKGVDATALGFNAQALNAQSLALGNQAKATGAWSIAIAQDTEASGHLSLAASYSAKTAGLQSVGIGVLAATSSAAENSVAIGTMAQALGENTTAIGPTAKVQGSRSVGLGQGATTESTAYNGTAIGRNAYIGSIRDSGGGIGIPSDGISQGDDTAPEAGKEHMNSTALGFAAKAFGFQNLSVGAGAETYDTNTIAIGVNAVAKDHYATALGKQARATGKNSTAIGHWATSVGEDSVSIGTLSTIQGLDGQTAVNKSATLGAYSRAAIDNSVALGHESLAYVGDDVATKAYLTDEAFAKENGVVSVGNAEYTIGETTVEANRRRITNVAGGADDYDAVNVAQLQAVEAEGLNFKGDGDTVVHRDLGTELIISGGNTDSTTLTENNIGVVADKDSGSLSVKLSKNVNLDDGSVTFVETAKDADGNVLVKGEDGNWYADLTDAVYDADAQSYTKDGEVLTAVANPVVGTVKLTSTGLDNGNQRITNVAAGVQATDAVNMSQLNDLNTKVDTNKIEYVSINSSEEGNKLNDGAVAKDTIAIGPNVKTTVEAGVAIGRNIDSKGGVAVGEEAYSSSRHSVAIGYGAVAGDDLQADVAIGDGAKARAYSVAIGNGADAFMDPDPKSNASGLAVAIGSGAKVKGQGSVAIGSGSLAEFSSSAMGIDAKANGRNAVSIGDRSNATGDSTVAIGTEAKTDSVYGVAIGPTAKGLGFGSVGIGGGAEATANWSMAMGQTAVASAQLGTALGHFSNVSSNNSTAIGSYARVTGGTDATAVGYKAQTTAGSAVALGANSLADRNGKIYGYTADGVTFSTDADVAAYLGKTEEYQSANEDFNAKLAVLREKQAALQADPNNEQLKKEFKEADAATKASFDARNAIVSAYRSGSGAVSVGSLGNTRQIINVAAGSEDTDAVNVAQLKALNTKVDANQIEYVSIKSSETENKLNDGATGDNSIAIGPKTKVTAASAVAIGSQSEISNSNFGSAYGATSKVTGSEQGTAIGYGAIVDNSLFGTALGTRANVTNSIQGTAVGQSANVSGSAYGTSLGTFSKVINSDSGIAIGSMANVNNANYGMAMGINSSVTNQGGTALGYGTAVTEKSGVALGLGAMANRSGEVYGYSPDGVTFTDDASVAAYLGKTAEFEQANQDYVEKVQIFQEKLAAYQQDPRNQDVINAYVTAANAMTESFEKRTGIIAAYKPSYGAVSVGGSGATRQIINVAAGSEDTDAVNLAQLKTVETIAKAHTELTLDGKSATAGADGALGEYIGENNLTMAVKDVNGQKVYDLKLKNEVVIGQPGKDGKDGTPGSIGLVGPQGPAGEDGQPGKNAYGEISVKNGVDGVDGKHGKDGITRIVYEDERGEEHTVATLEDGLKFAGDTENVTIAKKLNETLDVKGGISDASLLTDNNIGVVAQEKGGLTVKLAKNLNLSDGSVAFAETAKDKDGNALVKGEDGNWYNDLTDAVYDADSQTYTKDGAALTAVESPVVGAVKLSSTGLDNGNHRIVNVATGIDKTDAVNVGQLDAAISNVTTKVGGAHTELMLDGKSATAGADGALGEYIGENNLTMAVKDVNGQKVYDLKLKNEVVIGQPGKDGKDGTPGSIGLVGPQGPAGEDGQPGKNAYGEISVKNGVDGVDGKHGKDGITRIVYEDERGEEHTVATLEDGLKFAGDTENVTIAKKLNETLTVTGGISDASLLTDNNIGVVAEDKGGLTVKLAKNLDLADGSVRIGGTTTEDGTLTGGIYIASQKDVPTTKDGKTEDGLFITGLTNTKWNPDANGIVSGRAATEDQLNAAISKVSEAVGGAHTELTLDGKSATAGADGALGEYIGENNLTMAVKDVNGQKVYDLKLKNEVVIGQPGKDGKDGTPGSIGLVGPQGPAGEDGQPGKNAYGEISVKNGADGVDGKNGKDGMTRIVYVDENDKEHTVATLEDGLKFAGDTENVTIPKKLNETLEVKGGISDASMLTDNNIGVVAKADGGLTVKLAKHLNLADGSVAFAETAKDKDGNALVKGEDGNWYNDLTDAVYDADSQTYTKDGAALTAVESPVVGAVKLSSTGLDNGNHRIVNVATGIDKTDAVNVGQLDAAISNVTTKVGGAHTELMLDGKSATAGADGKLGDYIGENNLTMAVKDVNGQKVYDLKLKNEVVIGQPGKDGKDGTPGSIGLVGPQGPAGEDGQPGKNAYGEISVKNGVDGVDGKHGKDGITRIVYEDERGEEHTVATLEDGLKFAGDTENVTIAKKLNETLDVKGGISDASLLTDNNIGVVAKADGGLTVKLAKNLNLSDGSVAFAETAKDKDGNALVKGEDGNWYTDLTDAVYDADSQTYTKDGETLQAAPNPVIGTVKLSSTGLDNGNQRIVNVATGIDGTDAVNVDQLDAAISKVSSDVGGAHTELTLDGKSATAGANGALGEYIGENNLTMAVKDVNGQKVYDLKLKNEVVIGQPGKDGKDGKPGSIGLVGPQGPAGADGQPGKNAYGEISVKNGVDGVDGKHGKDGITRIVYEDENGEEHTVATLEDGLKFAGDTENVTIAKKLNETLDVKGGISDASLLSDNNIGVVAQDKGGLTVKLAKNLNLSDGSVAFEETAKDKDGNALVKGEDGNWYTDLTDAVYDADSQTYTKDGAALTAVESPVVGAVKLSSTGLDNGNHRIVNVATGIDKTDAVNVGQLDAAISNVTTKVGGAHTELMLDGKSATAGADGKLGDYIGENNLTMAVKDVNGQKVYDLKLKNEVVIGQPGKDGKDGKPGSIGLVGPQGPAGEDGQPGKNAYAEISVKNGVDGVDGKHGKDGITRIVYEDEKGEERVVATMDDGLKFVGDTENVTIAKKLNETLEVKGGISDASMLTDNNIGVVAKADGGLTVKLAKNLNLNDGSVRIGGTTGDDGTVTGGIYIANQKDVPTTKDGKTEDGLFITGLANTDWDPDSNGIVESRAATEKQLKAVADSSAKVDATNLSDTNVNSWKTKLGITDTLLSDAGAWKLTVNGTGERSIKKDSVINFVNGEKVQITQSGNDINVGLDTEFVKQVSDNTTNITNLDNRVTKVEGDVTNVKKDITKINNDITNINQDITNINTKIETIEGKAGVANVVGDTETGVKVEKVDANDATKGVKVSLEEKIKVGGITIDGKLPSEGETANRTITGLTNTKWDAENVVANRAATEGQLKDLSQKIKEVGEIKDGVRTYAGDDSGDNPLKRKNSEAMELRGGADSDNLSDNNIGVVTNKQKTGFDIKLSKDLKGLTSAEIGNVSISNNITVGTGDKKTVITDNSVTTGNTTINNDGLTIKNEDSSKNITIQTGNVNLGGNAIHNVGEATEANDAINKAQLDRTVTAIGAGMNEMSGRIGSLDRRVDRVGAGAAALAALHPLEYSPDAKWEVTAGLGNYRSTSAVALGAFYRPNYDTLFSIGASYGGGENMVNAGVTWRIGEGETKNYPSKQVMAQEIDTLKSALAQQNDKIESQSEQLEEQNKKIEQLMQAIEKLTK